MAMRWSGFFKKLYLYQERLSAHDQHAMTSTDRSLSDYLPAAGLLVVGLLGLAAAWLASGTDSGRYIVIAPPGSTLAQTISLVRAADGGLVGTGRLPNIVFAGSSRPDFPAALRRAGAWGVIATPASGGCTDPIIKEQTS